MVLLIVKHVNLVTTPSLPWVTLKSCSREPRHSQRAREALTSSLAVMLSNCPHSPCGLRDTVGISGIRRGFWEALDELGEEEKGEGCFPQHPLQSSLSLMGV